MSVSAHIFLELLEPVGDWDTGAEAGAWDQVEIGLSLRPMRLWDGPDPLTTLGSTPRPVDDLETVDEAMLALGSRPEETLTLLIREDFAALRRGPRAV